MDLSDLLKNLADRAGKLVPTLQTEEATKNALILPFLQALGWDVFNPNEVQPEYTTDIATKKGERVDFAILVNNKPVILLEAKTVTDKLDKADGQLMRYFHVSAAKFGILSNGLDYKFYTDLVEPNKMDEKPFLQVNILNLKESDYVELKKFHKSFFDVEQIFSTASELKYLSEVKAILAQEADSPSEDFVKHFIGRVYSGRATEKVVEQFKGIVKKGMNQFTSEIVSNKLKSVLDQEKQNEKLEAEAQEMSAGIETTLEEMEGYYIVKAIARQVIAAERIVHRDAQTYFAILVDDNNRKPICRLWLNANKKFLSVFDAQKVETKIEISCVDDIYKHSEAILKTAKLYVE